MSAKAIVLQLSPRRWTVAVPDHVVSGVPVYKLAEGEPVDNAIDALSRARALRGKHGAATIESAPAVEEAAP